MARAFRSALRIGQPRAQEVRAYLGALARASDVAVRSGVRWTERGLAIYADDAARPEAASDLRQRAARYRTKLGLRKLRTKVSPRVKGVSRLRPQFRSETGSAAMQYARARVPAASVASRLGNIG